MRFFLVLLIACATPAIAGKLVANVELMGGYDSNPSGLSAEDAQAMNWTHAQLGWAETLGSGSFSASYVGDLRAFTPNTDWFSHLHGAEVTYAWPFSTSIYQGLKGRFGVATNRDTYDAYNYQEAGGEFWTRIASKSVPTNFIAGLSRRTYGNSPEFDYDEFMISGSTRTSFSTRTTLAASVSYRIRDYRTMTYEDLLAGREATTSDQAAITGRISQGLGETSGLKLAGWALIGDGESRWRDDYWQSMDDPLASTGFGGRAQVSWLVPAGITLRTYVGAQRISRNYIDSEGYFAERLDKSGEAGVRTEGLLPWVVASRALDWSLETRLSKQTSDDPNYRYTRFSVMAGISYRW